MCTTTTGEACERFPGRVVRFREGGRTWRALDGVLPVPACGPGRLLNTLSRESSGPQGACACAPRFPLAPCASYSDFVGLRCPADPPDPVEKESLLHYPQYSALPAQRTRNAPARARLLTP